MKAQTINETLEIQKTPGSRLPNSEGFYPIWCDSNTSKLNITKALKNVVYLIHQSDFGDAVRVIMNKINNYLEKNEGFHYGVSKGFLEMENKKGVITEHGIPHHSQIIMLKKLMKEGRIKKLDDVIQFIRDNYTMCLISPDEDARLRKAKLTKGMPKDWKEWLERYKIADIDLVVKPGNKIKD